jgi:hypothetical protein
MSTTNTTQTCHLRITHDNNCNSNCLLQKTLDNDTSYVHISDDDSYLDTNKIFTTHHCLFSEDNSFSPYINNMANIPLICDIRKTHYSFCGAPDCLLK